MIVAQMMQSNDVILIQELSEQACWSLFEKLAFFGRPRSECEQLIEIGRKIVGKCKGLPLAAKTIGSLLLFKRSSREWQSILDSEMWQLEEFERGLLPPLLLSYNDMPSVIKQYFSYCAVFPKDCNIEKDELIKLWLAQGFIRPKGNKELEMIGEEYFDYLAARSFFQEFDRENTEGLIVRCKMHDLVHDFAQYLTKNECLSIEANGHSLSLVNNSVEKARHSMLKPGYDSFPDSIFSAKKLRSFLIQTTNKDLISPVLPVLFDQLTCLRTLKITGIGGEKRYYKGIVEIPKGIKKLIHLRFLKLVWLDIEELPETCCELFNLQTFEMVDCRSFRRLPQGVGKLVNLRNLSKFIVSRSGGCKLENLRQLRHLRGYLKIQGLGNVKDADEAKSAELEKKMNLLDLELSFDNEGRIDVNDEAIIEALRPPPNIESLRIEYHYIGISRWPSWIASLNKLKKVVLYQFYLCDTMPPLGKLPSLETLEITGNWNVKRVGDEFLGVGSGDHLHGIGASSSVIAFPKLKQLLFWNIYYWEEWDFRNGDNNITVMPQLKKLEFGRCKELKSLPDQLLQSTTLEELRIDDECPILVERYKKYTGQDWSKISHILNIKIGGYYS